MTNSNIVMIGIYVGSYVLATAGVHIIVNWILRRYQLPERGLRKAGATIGVLERMLVLTLVLIGQFAAIAIIFAAKSIARFEELKDREFAEYYLIGTLSSILFAMLVGILTTGLLNAIRP
jgi:heme A synthase